MARYSFDQGEYKGATVDLIGAVHVGTKEYYQALNKRFKSYDAMLYELVADPSANKPDKRADRGGFNPLGAMQTGMKDVLDLKFQLDEVDYSPSNFVHADISGEDFLEDMSQRGDSFIGLFARMMGAGLAAQNTKKGSTQQTEMIAAALAKDTLKLRRVMADQFESMDGQMAAMADKNGKSTLVTERNSKAFHSKRKLASVSAYNQAGEMQARWEIENCYPCKYTGPTLTASSGDMATETIELVHEGIKRVPAK